MTDEKKPRRVKVTDESAVHRVGAKRAAVKPHRRASAPQPKQVISSYLDSTSAKGLSQVFWGENLTRNAAVLHKNFALGNDEELYLLVDPSKSGRQGMMLSTSGLTVADGRGRTATIKWSELRQHEVACRNGMLMVGKMGVSSNDAQAMANLLKQIQQNCA